MARARKEASMKRKSGKPLVKVNKKIHVVHLNVGSGYVTYLEEDVRKGDVRVKGICIDTPSRKKAAKN